MFLIRVRQLRQSREPGLSVHPALRTPHALLVKAPRRLAQSCLCREVPAANTSDCIMLPVASTPQVDAPRTGMDVSECHIYLLLHKNQPWRQWHAMQRWITRSSVTLITTHINQRCILDMVTYSSSVWPLLSSSLWPYLTIPQLSKELPVHGSTWTCWGSQSPQKSAASPQHKH